MKLLKCDFENEQLVTLNLLPVPVIFIFQVSLKAA